MPKRQFDAVKDSGNRTEFETGAVRDARGGKGRYDLLQELALQRLAVHLENGAQKYGDDNWRKGIPLASFFDSAERHLLKYKLGFDDEDHLAAVLWNIACLIHTEILISIGRLPKNLDNMKKYKLTKKERALLGWK